MMGLLVVFVILCTAINAFLALLWRKDDIGNACIKFLFTLMCIYGIYLIVAVIPNISPAG